VAAAVISEADMAAPAAPSARMAEMMMIAGRMRMTPPYNVPGQPLGFPAPLARAAHLLGKLFPAVGQFNSVRAN
jgi:hypothetical protein